ncbi:MAG TPA: ArdC family protein [Edaphobacter sp.]|nr:ArdC family protein [Edaphobacter sp.]
MSSIATTKVSTLPSTPKAQTAKEVIAANVKLLIEQLEAGHSEGLTAYLTAMGKFHTYSFGNILEIARQMSSASRVAGMYAWNQLGRRVKKGEKGIRILAPMLGTKRKKDSEVERDITKQNQPVLVGFRAVYVFDRLSRDLCPARVRPVSRATPMCCSMAVVFAIQLHRESRLRRDQVRTCLCAMPRHSPAPAIFEWSPLQAKWFCCRRLPQDALKPISEEHRSRHTLL